MKNKHVELLEGQTPEYILYDVLNHIDNCLASLSDREFRLKMLCLVGSRIKGTHKEESDLDIAISYTGSLREDDCFNLLSEEPLYFEGIKVDFIPYSKDKGNDIDLSKRHYILKFVEEGEEDILFDEEKMKRLVKKDGLLKFVYTDLTSRKLKKADALKVIFNGYVLDDSAMILEYHKA